MILAALRFDALDENKSVSCCFSLVFVGFLFYNCGEVGNLSFTQVCDPPKNNGDQRIRYTCRETFVKGFQYNALFFCITSTKKLFFVE